MSDGPGTRPAARRIHVDTDPGLDDLLALALALGSPELDVRGVTTVAGNASIEAVTANAQRFLALAGESMPLGRGAEGPIALSRVDAELIHGEDGRRGVPIPAVDRRPVPAARDVLRPLLAQRALDRIVALGPLTNLAVLLEEEDAALFDGVEIVWMGGSLDGGNATGVAEFNCYADPAAAARVLGSSVPTRVVGLDVTRLVHLHERDIAPEMFGEGPMGRLIHALLAAGMDAEERIAGERRISLHDPCAILAALDPNLFRWERKQLAVIVDEGDERGRLCGEDLPWSEDAGGRGVRYAVEVNGPEVQRMFLERLVAYCQQEPA